MGSEPCDWNVQWANCLTLCTFTWTRQTHGSLHDYMHVMCACKRALILQSDAFMLMGSEPCDWNVHGNVRWAKCLTHCTFTCTRKILRPLHVYMHLVRACKRAVIRLSDVFAVSQMTDVCMKMCSEPIVWLSAHLHAHVRHTGHCTFTCM